MNFEELNLAAAILKAVREQGYETPTAIQAQAIPLILDGPRSARWSPDRNR
jgi:ATP-dependent RNA helicase RhlE